MKHNGHRRFTVPVASAVLTMCVVMLVTAQEPQRYARPELLVETTWLADHLDDQSIQIVDVRRDGYEDGHIPGAVWLDIAVTRDATKAPSFLPSPEAFARAMGELGISNETRVVFYDDRGGVYGARPWAVLNHYGHSNVSIVNGGWPKWVSERRASTMEVPNTQVVTFTPTPTRAWIATAEDVRRAIDDPLARILDTRTEAEIDGSDLRGIMRGGYVPSATAIHWEDTLEGEHQMFKSSAALYELFLGRGIKPTDSIVTYCEGGGRSAHELFVLSLLGYDDLRLYLGSWQDWGNRDDLPLATVAEDGAPR